MPGIRVQVVPVMCVLAAMVASGCGVGMEPLMPTPALYSEAGMDPLAHIPVRERWTPRRVYFVTTRRRSDDLQEIAYTNHVSDEVSVGLAMVGFGNPGMTWADLRRASTQPERDGTIKLSIAGVVEVGRFAIDASPESAAGAQAAGWMLADLNDSIEDARDQDILIYVHGAKVNFYNA